MRRNKGPAALLLQTVPEVRRLHHAVIEPLECFGFRLAWSTFRRRHHATERCHVQRRTGSRQPRSPTIQRLDTVDLELTDERWERIATHLPQQKPDVGRPNNDHRMIL